LDLGINLIDTGANYGGDHRSEQITGEALKGRRGDAIIATKGGALRGAPPAPGSPRDQLVSGVEASLHALDTDYIDVYHIRSTPAGSTVEETLRTFGELVQAGKVRFIGLTNSHPWRLGEAVWTARTNEFPAPVSEQSLYSIIDRGIEAELVPCCREYGVGLMPYYSLAGGFLTGRYRRGEQAPEGSRFGLAESQGQRWLTDDNFDLLDRLEAFAADRDLAVADLAFAWLLTEPAVGSVIAGASNVGQVEANAAAGDGPLSDADQTALRELVSAGNGGEGWLGVAPRR
jgi:aryl-alcohol dehydrogenase-like predicted oxidoreductase